MALRLVYQISCTVIKPSFLENSSECLRRFRSLSPVLKPADERGFSSRRNDGSHHCSRRRSHSYPRKSLMKTGSPCYHQTNRLLSTEGEDEDEPYEDYHRDETENERPSQGPARKNMQAKSSPGLQIKRQQSAFRFQSKQAQPVQRARSNSAIRLNAKAEAHLHQYHLKDSVPEEKINVFNVFEYYSEQYKRRASTVMPHLQPHNLKPYGTGENLTFPTHYKSRSIKYPAMESDYGEQVSNKPPKKGKSGDKERKNFSTSCKASASDEQLQKCKQLLADYKKANPGYTPPKKKLSIAPGSSEEASFLQKTMKLISEFNVQQIRRRPTKGSSEDLHKCNQVISDYKKINPDYKPVKKEVKSGSQEEKEAVNKALNFAANYKKFSHNNNKQENQGPKFPLRNNAVSECMIKDHSNWSVKPSEKPPQPEVDEEVVPDILVSSFSLPKILNNLPEVPVMPVTVRVGPKANLLQSNAPPEVALLWDNVRLERNEKLTSPWPSYADHLKRQIGPTKKTREIIYPMKSDNLKLLKNTKNIEIQSVKVQPKLELSTRSLHKNVKCSPVTEVAAKNEESWRKNQGHGTPKKGTSMKTHRSLPNLRYFVRGCSTTAKGTFCNEKTVPPKRFRSKDVCDMIEFEYPPTTTDFFNSHDCKCVEQRLPLDVPPLARPKKRSNPKERLNICPVIKTCTTPRADAGLQTKRKCLRKIIPAQNCPCIEQKMKEGCPLPRLKKACVREPPKICPPCMDIKCNCPPRADEGLQIKKKCLPKLTPSKDCHCIDPIFIDVPPLKPLKKVVVLEPKRICLVPRFCDMPRADSSLKAKIKPLPKIAASDCPCVEPEPLKTVPLARLKRVNVEEPARTCTKKPPESPYRADGKIKIPPRSLPPLDREDCPCVEPKIPIDVKPLSRLKKRSNPVEPPKICPVIKPCSTPRADEKLTIEKRKLPEICPADNCPCIVQKMNEGCPLARLKKACVKEPPKICPPCMDITCNCPPRADRCLKIEKKCLPVLKPGGCPCYEPKIPVDVPRLKQLKKVKIDEPGNTCPPPPNPCPPRADDKMVTKLKKLPKLVASGCECVEDPPLKNVPLPRLKRNEVCEPSNACPEVTDRCDPSQTDRADEICKYTIKAKKLPPMLLKAEHNRVSLRGFTNKARKSKTPKLNTSHKRKFSMYSKMNGSWKARRILSAINFSLSPVNNYCKRLVQYWVEEEDPCRDITPKLKRLSKFKGEDVDRSKLLQCQRESEYGSPRADANWKIKKKPLPRLEASKCPDPEIREPYSKKNQPQLKRLPRLETQDIDWSKRRPCSKPEFQSVNPRADDNRMPRTKSLPKIMDEALDERPSKFDNSDTKWETIRDNIARSAVLTPHKKPQGYLPCTYDKREKRTVKEVVLRRLPKFKKNDIDWKAILACHKTYTSTGVVPRADRNQKTEQKYLPKLKDGDCPFTNRTHEMVDAAPLKRLPKFKQNDVDWKGVPSCDKTYSSTGVIPRADWNLKEKKKCLPKLIDSDCEPIDNTLDMLDNEPLKRLHKFKKDDVDWDAIPTCHKTRPPTGVVPRADWNLKEKKKCLPKLMDSDCEPIDTTLDMQAIEPLKRLQKFKEDDIDWDDIPTCHKTRPPTGVVPRADWNLKTKKKCLPKLIDSDCEPIDNTLDMLDNEPLKRLHKFKTDDVDWDAIPTCHKTRPPTGVVPRADWNMKTKKKILPKLMDSDCEPIDTTLNMQAIEPLKRLQKFKEDDTDWDAVPSCHKNSPSTGVIPRADWNLKEKKKCLPKLIDSDCEPIDNTLDMLDNEPLKRLHKFKKDDVDWDAIPTCHKTRPPTGVVPRADWNMKTKKKILPKLMDSDCEPIDTALNMQAIEPLTRLQKFKEDDTDWDAVPSCHKNSPSTGVIPRADWNLKEKKKCLPKLIDSDCEPIDNTLDMLDNEPLKRLHKFKKDDLDWGAIPSCHKTRPPTGVVPRADWNMKTKKKILPKLMDSDCEPIDTTLNMQAIEPLKRLQKFKEDDTDWDAVPSCHKNSPSTGVIPRADWNLKEKKKCLPKLIDSDCEPIDNTLDMLDNEPLKRLHKFKKDDVEWDAIPTCNKARPPTGVVPRADWNLKEKKKCLPKLMDSDCKPIDTTLEMQAIEPLKRLQKFKEDDTDWDAVPSCHKNSPSTGVIPRADWNLKEKKKCLPKLIDSDCEPIDNTLDMLDNEPLKRLHKFKKDDVEWDAIPTCNKTRPPTGVVPRADWNLKEKKKCLPKLMDSDCKPIDTTLDMQAIEPLKRLQKFKEDDTDWGAIASCDKRRPSTGVVPRADAKLKIKSKSLPQLTAGTCPRTEFSVDLKSIPLQRLPKFEKEDKNWKESAESNKTYSGAPRADRNLKPRSKSLPQLKPSRCPCKNEEAPPKGRKYPNRSSSSQRADELLGYECKKKKLPPLLPTPSRKSYHTARRLPSYPIYPIYRDVAYVRHQRITTTTSLLNEPPKGANKNPNKGCEPLRTKKKLCPKQKPLPGCKPRGQETCQKDFPFKDCSKQKSPYPSFSECGSVAEWPKCECNPNPDMKVLQPHYPLIQELKLLKAPPPDQGFIDVLQEKKCALKKLGKTEEGETKSCDNFNDPPKEAKAAEMLAGAKQEPKPKCAPPKKPCPKPKKPCPTPKKACPEPKTKNKETFCGRRAKANKAGKSACPQPSAKKGKEQCAAGPPRRKSVTELCANREKNKAKRAAPPRGKSVAELCANREKNKAKCAAAKATPKKAFKPMTKKEAPKSPCQAATKNAFKPGTKQDAKAASKSASKASIKHASTSGPPAVIPQEKPKGFFASILAFFTSKPKPAGKSAPAPPKSASALKKAPSATAAETCPSKSKSTCTAEKKCPKPPKSLCKKKPEVAKCGGQSKEKACKPPTKKGASKVKKKPIPKKGKAAACGKAKAECPAPKKSSPCAQKAKPKKKAAPKKPKAANPCAKEEKFVCPPTHEELEARCADPCAKKSEQKKEKPFVCPPTHEELEAMSGNPCATRPPPSGGGVERRPADPCAARKGNRDPCSCPAVHDHNKFKSAELDKIKPKQKKVCTTTSGASKFAKMFPPDMPDLTPRRRIRRKVRPRPAPKCTPMDACMRLTKNWADTLIESNEESEKVCRTQEASVCKPKAQETVCPPPPPKDECKPKKAKKPKAPFCKTRAKAPIPKKSKAKSCKPKKSKAKKPKAAACKTKAKAPKPKKAKSKICTAKPATEVCKTQAKPKTKAPKKACPKKEAPKSPCPKKEPPQAACPKKPSKCTKIKSDCPPKGREACDKVWVFKKCKAQESPYPSFSECRPPFPHQRISECLVAKKRAKATLETLRKSLERQKKTQEDGKCKEKNKRSYSTMCAVARARWYLGPPQWRRNYSSGTGGRGPNDSSQSLDKTKKKSEDKNGKRNEALNQRLLESIEEGIENLEAQDDLDLPNNLYYQVLKALQKLSEQEVYDFFDQEAQFNPLCLLKGDVNETVSFVCKLDPRAQQTLFANNDINFQPRCVGISDPNALTEEMKVVEAFKNLCKKLCEEADYHDLPYEELERLKTEDMRRELDELLRKAQNKQ